MVCRLNECPTLCVWCKLEAMTMIEVHVFVAVVQEKTVQNIEGFDKSKLKHTETTEKQSLPDTTGD